MEEWRLAILVSFALALASMSFTFAPAIAKVRRRRRAENMIEGLRERGVKAGYGRDDTVTVLSYLLKERAPGVIARTQKKDQSSAGTKTAEAEVPPLVSRTAAASKLDRSEVTPEQEMQLVENMHMAHQSLLGRITGGPHVPQDAEIQTEPVTSTPGNRDASMSRGDTADVPPSQIANEGGQSEVMFATVEEAHAAGYHPVVFWYFLLARERFLAVKGFTTPEGEKVYYPLHHRGYPEQVSRVGLESVEEAVSNTVDFQPANPDR